jgi:aryl-alcohol dehydrogenase-like predicted oxidoreductase
VKAAQAIREFARTKGFTPAQVALTWVLHKGNDIVPIPGTKRRKYLEENLGAAAIKLTSSEISTLDAALAPGKVAGPRYTKEMMAQINR